MSEKNVLSDTALAEANSPRSYFRSMQPILQLARKYFTKTVNTLSSTLQHFAFKRA